MDRWGEDGKNTPLRLWAVPKESPVGNGEVQKTLSNTVRIPGVFGKGRTGTPKTAWRNMIWALKREVAK